MLIIIFSNILHKRINTSKHSWQGLVKSLMHRTTGPHQQQGATWLSNGEDTMHK